jgi:hypothetical protein
MKRQRFACLSCPAFYKCEKPDMAATAGGYETKQIDGETVICCRPASAWGRKRTMRQYAYYCLATSNGHMIAGMADFTGNVPKWCPRLEITNGV